MRKLMILAALLSMMNAKKPQQKAFYQKVVVDERKRKPYLCELDGNILNVGINKKALEKARRTEMKREYGKDDEYKSGEGYAKVRIDFLRKAWGEVLRIKCEENYTLIETEKRLIVALGAGNFIRGQSTYFEAGVRAADLLLLNSFAIGWPIEREKIAHMGVYGKKLIFSLKDGGVLIYDIEKDEYEE